MSREILSVKLVTRKSVNLEKLSGIVDGGFYIHDMSFQQNKPNIMWVLFSTIGTYDMSLLRFNTENQQCSVYEGLLEDYNNKEYHAYNIACNNNILYVIYKSNKNNETENWDATLVHKPEVKAFQIGTEISDDGKADFIKKPSKLDSVEDFGLNFYNVKPTGAYTPDGRVLYVTDSQYKKVFAYNIECSSKQSYGSRLPDKEFQLHPINKAPRSIWFEKGVWHVHDLVNHRVYGYDMDTLDTFESGPLWFNGRLESFLTIRFPDHEEEVKLPRTCVAKSGDVLYTADSAGISVQYIDIERASKCYTYAYAS